MLKVRTPKGAARAVSRAGKSMKEAVVQTVQATQDEKPTRRAKKVPVVNALPSEDFGRNIYVFSHLQTKQVLYSLQPSIHPHQALKQFPYNGKKTVPSGIRKDLWHPMATIEFSKTPKSSHLGLSTYQKLREYRKLHELLWPKEEMEGLTRKSRGRKLMNQRANTVADMAAALYKVLPAEESDEPSRADASKSAKPELREVTESETREIGSAEDVAKNVTPDKNCLFIRGIPSKFTKETFIQKMADLGMPTPTFVLLHRGPLRYVSFVAFSTAEDSERVMKEMNGVSLKDNEGTNRLVIVPKKTNAELAQIKADAQKAELQDLLITVKWTDMLDAEYAASWPKLVVHDILTPPSRKKKKNNSNGSGDLEAATVPEGASEGAAEGVSEGASETEVSNAPTEEPVKGVPEEEVKKEDSGKQVP